MRTLLSLLLLCCCLTTICGQATLKGILKSKVNETIPYGTYKISASSVGDKKASLNIIVDRESLDIVFNLQSDTQLDEVELFESRNKRAEKLETLTRLPLAPNEQLQSISILSHKLIEQQNALSLSDVSKNVAGVYTFATYGNIRESMSLRGYKGNNIFNALGYNTYRTVYLNRISPTIYGTTLNYKF